MTNTTEASKHLSLEVSLGYRQQYHCQRVDSPPVSSYGWGFFFLSNSAI